MAKMTTKKPVTKTTTRTPVTPANTQKFTDQKKKAVKTNAGPGVSLAKPGTPMRSAQETAAKQKAEAFKKKYGSYPTPEFVAKYKKMYGKNPS